MTTLVVNNTGQIVEFSETTVEVVTAGLVGPQGPQGVAGPAGGATIEMTAGENLGGRRAVVSSSGLAMYADSAIAAHQNRVIGITAGSVVNVVMSGQLFGLFGLTPDMPIYLSNSGTLTQTVPATGFIQQLGTAITADSMSVNIYTGISYGS
jgi:hypothetical protein